MPTAVSTLFDVDRLRAEAPVDHIEFHSVHPSTNDRALELAKSDALAVPALVLTESQTAGRGRGTNRWWSSPGALMFSLIVEPESLSLAQDVWPRISLTAAVAVCEQLRRWAPGVSCGLRWPNDVFFAGKKLCGILIEIPTATADGRRRLVLGMGLNVNNSFRDAPDEQRRVATSLADETSRMWDLTECLLDVLTQLHVTWPLLADRSTQLHERWQSLCLLTGRTVRLQLGGREVLGRVRQIDHDGALVIDTPDGTERFFGGVLKLVEDD